MDFYRLSQELCKMNGKNNFPPSNKIKPAQNSPMKKICALFSAIILMFSNAFATDANRNSFTVLESNSTKIVLKAEVTGFKLLPVETPQGVQFKAVIDNGTSILEKGAPDLQKLCGSVIVPDHKMMKITSTIYLLQQFRILKSRPPKETFFAQLIHQQFHLLTQKFIQEILSILNRRHCLPVIRL